MSIPTTLEMDGIYTDRDRDDRFFVMKPCVDCLKYNKQDLRQKNKKCVYCGGNMGINGKYWYSIRTWPGDKKLTAADKNKLGRQ